MRNILRSLAIAGLLAATANLAMACDNCGKNKAASVPVENNTVSQFLPQGAPSQPTFSTPLGAPAVRTYTVPQTRYVEKTEMVETERMVPKTTMQARTVMEPVTTLEKEIVSEPRTHLEAVTEYVQQSVVDPCVPTTQLSQSANFQPLYFQTAGYNVQTLAMRQVGFRSRRNSCPAVGAGVAVANVGVASTGVIVGGTAVGNVGVLAVPPQPAIVRGRVVQPRRVSRFGN